MRRFELHGRAGSAWMVALFLAVTLPILARDAAPPLSRQQAVQTTDRIARVVLPPMDAAAELAADAKAGRGTPLRYANPLSVEMTPATHGTWENLPEGRLWRLRFASDGATDLNFGFSKFWLPEGATLHICSDDKTYFQGPFTARDNKPHGELWTPVVPGGSACLELFVPTAVTEEPQIILASVNRGYRDMFRNRQELARANATCEIGVACPQGAGWSNEIRSVALYSVSGTNLCTGTLIANVAGDLRNFFLTAYHCGITTGSVASVVVYWNFQSPSCDQWGGGSLEQNQSGAIFCAARADVDFALIELEDVPDPRYKVFYSGWDRSGVAPMGAVGIHHPSSKEKAISLSSTLLTNCMVPGATGTHWQVVWSAGVTEDGSSGSGIWNPTNHRLIGTLTGGTSSCSVPDGRDCYGKFSVAWASGDSSASRLRDWLDPDNTGVTEAPGVDPGQRPILTPIGWSLLAEGCTPTNNAVDPTETVTISFGLKNVGGASTSNLIAALEASGGVTFPSDPQEFGAVPAEGVVWRSFTFTADGSCGGAITPTLLLQDATNLFAPLRIPLTLGRPIGVVFSQTFDAVSAPTLPAGWATSLLGNGNLWATSTAQRDSTPNAVFAANPAATNDNRLTTPSMSITSPATQVAFRHRYLTETGFDGGVLEISINGGAFVDILAAGGSFVSHGYDQILDDTYKNPLGGREAWTGNSDGFVSTTANLPASAAGQSIRLRWRFGSDVNIGAVGWYVDNVLVFQGYQCCRPLVPPVIVDTRQLGTNVAFSYNSATGQSYIVESKLTTTDGMWLPFQTNVGDGTLLSYTNTAPGTSQRLFRLRTE